MKNLFRKTKKNIFRLTLALLSTVLILLITSYYINYKYTLITNNFYSKFNECNFKEAKNIFNSNNIFIKLKQKSLNKDLNNYFSSIVDNLCDDMLNEKINKDDALTVFKEIKSYNILNSSLNKLILSLDENYIPKDSDDYKALLDLGIENYNNNKVVESINLLRKIPKSCEQYTMAKEYLSKCTDSYKKELLSKADDLVSIDYYTQAIDLLSSVDLSIVSRDDPDIKAKIESINDAKESYLASIDSNDNKNTKSTATSLLQTITSNNVNNLYIESLTPSLIYVSLKDQITYIYSGSINNWTLEKSFPCSTGIEEESTPTGIFDIRERGDWFFSAQYGQGGKYWVQFLGDYLFHSLPYNEDQSKILDHTLGSPASHGCIRLKTEDAKWIYDNIKSGTKVIIS